MTKLFTTLALAATLFLSSGQIRAQQYQSLLWEISGNGLKKKSYLYGTMHVSGRIAYLLGEEFFQALNAVDAMALESNPIIWLKEITSSSDADQFLGRYYISSQLRGDYYEAAFQVEVPENDELGSALARDNFLMNWLLYRENKGRSDFEEDTFLDMFIYQAGRKTNKTVYSLEDFKETNRITMLANLPDEEEPSPSDWYVKLTKEKSYYELLQDAYRNQNLDFLDSLQAEVSGENYLKYMLYERNIIMANNIDSLIRSGISLFSGVGAAHLPGQKGMIELLRAKGYTVKPIKPTITDKAKEEKEKLSKLKIEIPYQDRYETEQFKVALSAPMYETYSAPYQRDFFAPELTNGSFFSVAMVSTFARFSGTSKVDYAAKVDSLLFEYIPGKIEEKKSISKSGYPGFDIVNKTKAGDYQRYQVFFTPLHMLVFKMGGKHEWVQKDGNKFFSSIELTSLNQPWKRVEPLRGDFSVEIPGFYSMKANTTSTGLYDHPEIEAFDGNDSSYYFLRRGAYQDMTYIEEDAFELNRILQKFIEKLDIDSLESSEIGTFLGYPSMTGYAKTAEGKYLHMKTFIRGAYYYFMASVQNDEQANAKFFDSFKFEQFKYEFPATEYYDSLMRFKVNSYHITPNPIYQQIQMAEDRIDDKKVKNELEKSYNKDRDQSYYTENYEEVLVDMTVYSPFYFISDLNEYWDKRVERIEEDLKLNESDRKTYDQDAMKVMEVTFKDSLSSRTIYKKFVLNLNRLYVLTANLDTVSQKSPYVEQFFNTFQPVNEDPNAVSVFDDKAAMFFEQIKSEDSLTRDAALMAVNSYVKFNEKHVDQMIEVIKSYPFPTEYIESKKTLIADLGKIKHPKVLPFLSDYYMKVTDTSAYQIAILEALGNQKTKKATELFVKLLDKDIPVVGEARELDDMFRPFYDSIQLTEFLFPELLNYTFVNSTYESEIYYLARRAVAMRAINPKSYKRFTNDMVKKAKILVKAERSEMQNKKNYNGVDFGLIRFAYLLFPFERNKQVKELVSAMKMLNDRCRAELIPVFLKNGTRLNKAYFEAIEKSISNYYRYAEVIEDLEEKEKENLPQGIVDQEKVGRSYLFFRNSYNSFDETKDSIVFIKKEWVKTRRQEGWVYFYKTKREREDKWSMAYIGIQPEDLNEFTTNLTVSATRITIPRGIELDDLIQEKIKEIELKDRRRAQESSYNDYGFDFF